MKFSDGSRNNHMWGPSQLSTSFCSQLILCIYATTNELGGGRPNFVPGRRKPKVRHRLYLWPESKELFH